MQIFKKILTLVLFDSIDSLLDHLPGRNHNLDLRPVLANLLDLLAALRSLLLLCI